MRAKGRVVHFEMNPYQYFTYLSKESEKSEEMSMVTHYLTVDIFQNRRFKSNPIFEVFPYKYK